MIINTRSLLVLIIALAMPFVATAQYRQDKPLADYYRQLGVGNNRALQRINIGIGKHYIPGSADLEYSGTDTLGAPLNVTTDARLKSRHSYTLHFGTFFPVWLLSDNSQLCFGIEVMNAYTELAIDSVVFGAKRVYRRSESITMTGVPISLDYKTGGEVSLSKANRTMFTLGAGLNFCGYNVYRVKNHMPFQPVPFIKVEAGFYAGIAMKLRATAYFGSANFIDRPTTNVISGDVADVLTTKSHTGFGYSLSFLIIPISYNWTKL